MYKDFVKISVRSLRKRGLRSWLTMIGIFIGIALFVSLISLGQGLQNAINEQFDIMGSDKIFIQPLSFGAPGTGNIKFYEDDKEVVGSVEDIDKFAAWNFRIGRIEHKDYLMYNYVMGLPTNEEMELIEEFSNYGIEQGRWIRKGDRYKANIGWDLANVPNILGPKTLKTGDKLVIEEQEFEIIGIVTRVGNPSDDRSVFISLETFEDLYDVDKEYDFIIAQAKPGVDPEEVASELKRKLRDERDEEEGEETFEVQTSENFRESFNDIFAIVQYFVAGLAFISMLVGGVGIMNTMYTAVLERTKEIGIMKAIGARNSDILKMFLIEAGLIGLIGGTIGIIIGFSASKFVEFIIKNVLGFELLSVRFNIPLMAMVFLFSILFGAVAGVFPAKQASEQKPVDALRYE
ncbi:FtsX-like permease family protein [Candidatus Woesearchaeota archaeon]|nr:FtsX-like permease family protein [Candidatus Woesearchaeota archaeon]